MKQLILIVGALLTLCACAAQPEYVDPRSLPIMLGLGEHIETAEPERYQCRSSPLYCKLQQGVRLYNAQRECTCLL